MSTQKKACTLCIKWTMYTIHNVDNVHTIKNSLIYIIYIEKKNILQKTP